MAGVPALVLRRASIRDDVADEVRACIGAARLEPKKVQVQLLFGDPNVKRQRHCGLWLDGDDAVLGTFSTIRKTPEGAQPVSLGFILPRAMLPPYELDETKKEQLVRILADMLLADLEREGLMPPRLTPRSWRGW